MAKKKREKRAPEQAAEKVEKGAGKPADGKKEQDKKKKKKEKKEKKDEKDLAMNPWLWIGGGVLFIILIIASIKSMPKAYETDEKPLVGCESNIATINHLIESYADKHGGKYPGILADLGEAIPQCPSAKKDTYSESYKLCQNAYLYYFYCLGDSHVGIGLDKDCPQFSSQFGASRAPIEDGKLPKIIEQLNYAFQYEEKGEYQKALESFQWIAENRLVHKMSAYLDIGRIYEKMGKEAEAKENYLKAASSPLDNSLVLLDLEASLERVGEKDKAIGLLEGFIASQKDSPGLPLVRGEIFRMKGDTENARKSYEEALKTPGANQFFQKKAEEALKKLGDS